MNIARLLRRAVRKIASRKNEPWTIRRLNRTADDIESQLRIMSDEEFAEYLRLHSRSHWWKA
ncbi:MAG: hypothetical protein AB1508_08060 [Pseudomonadota bacterium]